MVHLSFVGMLVTAVFALLLILTNFQKRKKQKRELPDIGNIEVMEHAIDDSILGIRKVEREIDPIFETRRDTSPSFSSPDLRAKPQKIHKVDPKALIVLNIMTKPERSFLGYELLQSLLSAGMRYGEMNIFHRYQDASTKGAILFSLASATEPGTFDIQKMGSTSCKGLCLFMQVTGDALQDAKVFNMLLDTAEQLANDLDGIVCGRKREPLTEKEIIEYRALIQKHNVVELEESTVG